MLDFRMESFIAVCRHLSFTKAAADLSLTQPAVSQHIRFFEQSYGAKLLEYAGKKLTVTPAGEALYWAALAIQHDSRQLRLRISELGTGRRILGCGATRTVGAYILPPRLSRYLKAHPDTGIKMVVENSQHLLSLLDTGEIDFAVVEGFFAKQRYDHRICLREPYLGVCADGHQFLTPPQCFEDLLDEVLIVREPGSGNRELLENALESRNLTLRDFRGILEVSDICAMKTLVGEDCGIAFLYAAAVQEELERGVLSPLPIGDLSHEITFLWQKGSVFSPWYEALFEELFPPSDACTVSTQVL